MMSRIFAFVTFLCFAAIIFMEIAMPQDPLFVFAANAPLALATRVFLAILMFIIAFGPEVRNPKYRTYIGLAGFGLITLTVGVLAATQGSGIYPYLQPADLLSGIIVGITLSIVSLETETTTSSVMPSRYFFYQDLEHQPEAKKRLKTSPTQKPA